MTAQSHQSGSRGPAFPVLSFLSRPDLMPNPDAPESADTSPAADRSENPDQRTPMLSVAGVSKTFSSGTKTTHALENVSLNVGAAEFVCFVGPSGCGKTTLLNMLAGLETPDTGSITFRGSPVTAPAADRMMMFQESALFPWLTALGNVMFPLRVKPGMSTAEARATAEHYLELVGLSAFRNAFIHELSGGMKQRVALARALAPDPHLLLMDEPFAALDAMTREQLYLDLQRIWAETKKLIVFVTHNVREAVCLGDRVVVFGANPGRIRANIRIDLPRTRDINDAHIPAYAAELTKILRSSADAGPADPATRRLRVTS
jgi:NitT/TauT family transport system ATP-binding protein